MYSQTNMHDKGPVVVNILNDLNVWSFKLFLLKYVIKTEVFRFYFSVLLGAIIY